MQAAFEVFLTERLRQYNCYRNSLLYAFIERDEILQGNDAMVLFLTNKVLLIVK
jgi:hypothetical protein